MNKLKFFVLFSYFGLVTINRSSLGTFVFRCQRTKVKGVKTIRYRRNLNHKLCRLGSSFEVTFRLLPSVPYEKSKSLGSGASIRASEKVKRIDGRAPPGVELAA
ncbi:hypothetical protein PFDG_05557 [Plasmodium falciparum Dd2]|uniref:Secreted protein n=1 Tax=Plasmodium falciparum (isolate Dd2) TaxID=57267 RepID=A0A0L7M506_PLAF4|nr:hypothetical protein PFDG_05557 [Plasmodium falciparum Dd2]